MFLRIGLREGKFPFGNAAKGRSRWVYYINERRFRLWMDGADMREENNYANL